MPVGTFKLRRFFSMASFAGMALVVMALTGLYRSLTHDALVDQATRSHVALARSFANTIWLQFADFVDEADHLSTAQLRSRPEIGALHEQVQQKMRGLNVVKIKIYSINGRTVFSTDPAQIGDDKSGNIGLETARTGKTASELTFRNQVYSFEGTIADRHLLSSYIPITEQAGGEVKAVFELYSDVSELVERLEQSQQFLVSGVVFALSLYYAFLYFIIRRADILLREQETERQLAAERIHHQANHDSLTGLPNRTMFAERLAEAIRRAKRTGRPVGLMLLDLDRFKVVNDSLGHEAGDELLVAVAKRISAAVRETDTLFRMGGDEFTVLLEYLRSDQDASRVAERIVQGLTEPFRVSNHELIVTTTIGISVFPRDDESAERLVKNADAAMYCAKEAGRNRYKFYTQDMNAQAEERLILETGLRKALKENQFVLYYQPKVAVDTGKVVGLEALLRWRHPEKGLVPPDKFLPFLEDTGLIVPVGEWVIRQACTNAQRWGEEGLPPLRVSVNISSLQFRANVLVEQVRSALTDTGLDPQRLELELTESLLVENTESAVELLTALKALGVYISIDDFGTGYSSLSYLKQFPVDALKIDRSFIHDLVTDRKDAAITSAITALAHSLGLGVVAEGVENQEQLRFLRTKGCHEIQGYMVSKPLPLNEVKAAIDLWERANVLAEQQPIATPAASATPAK